MDARTHSTQALLDIVRGVTEAPEDVTMEGAGEELKRRLGGRRSGH